MGYNLMQRADGMVVSKVQGRSGITMNQARTNTGDASWDDVAKISVPNKTRIRTKRLRIFVFTAPRRPSARAVAAPSRR